MKKFNSFGRGTRGVSILAIFVITLIMAISCASFGESKASFSEIEGKEWILSEVKSGAGVKFNRSMLKTDSMSGYYTISFKDGTMRGTGAPNLYSTSYTSGSGKALSFDLIISTMMWAETPEGLSESEYFNYLSRVTRWDIKGGKLELYSSNSGGAETVLVYTTL